MNSFPAAEPGRSGQPAAGSPLMLRSGELRRGSRLPLAAHYGLAMLLLLGGFVTQAGAHPTGRDRPIVIGTVYNLHGFQANLDVPSAQGARLAIDEVNRAGGLLGRELELAVVNGLSKPRVITHKTAALMKRIPAMTAWMGHSDADMALAAAPVAAAAKRLFLTSGATSPRLPGVDLVFLATGSAGGRWTSYSACALPGSACRFSVATASIRKNCGGSTAISTTCTSPRMLI